jgi:hypothetical protein
LRLTCLGIASPLRAYLSRIVSPLRADLQGITFATEVLFITVVLSFEAHLFREHVAVQCLYVGDRVTAAGLTYREHIYR